MSEIYEVVIFDHTNTSGHEKHWVESWWNELADAYDEALEIRKENANFEVKVFRRTLNVKGKRTNIWVCERDFLCTDVHSDGTIE